VTVTDVASSRGLQVTPAATGPSPTSRVTATGPAVIFVKVVVAFVGVPNVPLAADHR
jgi:hypothetical protein